MRYLLAQQRPPPVECGGASPPVPSTVQAVLDALTVPAFVETAAWDIVAWNQPMTALNDVGKLAVRDRNVLRRTFLDPAMKWSSPPRRPRTSPRSTGCSPASDAERQMQ